MTITQDARQAVAVGSQITMSSTDTISSEQAGTISVNGYQINILEGDTLDVVRIRINDRCRTYWWKSICGVTDYIRH